MLLFCTLKYRFLLWLYCTTKKIRAFYNVLGKQADPRLRSILFCGKPSRFSNTVNSKINNNIAVVVYGTLSTVLLFI